MTIKMYKSYWRSVSKALLAALLLSSFVCNGFARCCMKSNDLGEKLRKAAKAGKLEKVKKLVARGADTRSSRAQVVNAEYNMGATTVLHAAAYCGHLDVVRCLVEHGAKHDATNKHGKTPLDLAAQYRHQEIVDYLEKVGRGHLSVGASKNR